MRDKTKKTGSLNLSYAGGKGHRISRNHLFVAVADEQVLLYNPCEWENKLKVRFLTA